MSEKEPADTHTQTPKYTQVLVIRLKLKKLPPSQLNPAGNPTALSPETIPSGICLPLLVMGDFQPLAQTTTGTLRWTNVTEHLEARDQCIPF